MEKRGEERRIGKRELFISVDGLDGIGKGEIERALISFEQKLGRSVLDCISFSRAHSKGLPEIGDFWQPPNIHYNTIVTSDPSYAGIGVAIRDEIIARNERNYNAVVNIQAYAIDRLITMKKTVIPALKNGVRVIQSRCVAASLTYQFLKAIEENIPKEKAKEMILKQTGNKLQLEWAPDLLIIPTIKDMKKLIERLENRKKFEKDDKSVFDNLTFQEKLKPLYESKSLKQLFESHGTEVKYLDAGVSPEHTRKQALEIYIEFLRKKGCFNQNH